MNGTTCVSETSFPLLVGEAGNAFAPSRAADRCAVTWRSTPGEWPTRRFLSASRDSSTHRHRAPSARSHIGRAPRLETLCRSLRTHVGEFRLCWLGHSSRGCVLLKARAIAAFGFRVSSFWIDWRLAPFGDAKRRLDGRPSRKRSECDSSSQKPVFAGR